MSMERHCDHCRELAEDALTLVVPAGPDWEQKEWDLCARCVEDLNSWLLWKA